MGGIIQLTQYTNYWYTLYNNRVISQLISSYVQPQQNCSYFAQSNATLVRQSRERLIGNHAQIKTLKIPQHLLCFNAAIKDNHTCQ